MIQDLFLIALAVGLLFVGADSLVRGAASLADRFGLSALAIGLTVVAFGTSAPELVVGIRAALADQPEIVFGNVVGSNLFNLLGVLGISGLVGADPLAVEQKLLTFDVPIMIIGALVCLPMMASGGRLERWEGAILVAAFLTYVTFLVVEQAGVTLTA